MPGLSIGVTLFIATEELDVPPAIVESRNLISRNGRHALVFTIIASICRIEPRTTIGIRIEVTPITTKS